MFKSEIMFDDDDYEDEPFDLGYDVDTSMYDLQAHAHAMNRRERPPQFKAGSRMPIQHWKLYLPLHKRFGILWKMTTRPQFLLCQSSARQHLMLPLPVPMHDDP